MYPLLTVLPSDLKKKIHLTLRRQEYSLTKRCIRSVWWILKEIYSDRTMEG